MNRFVAIIGAGFALAFTLCAILTHLWWADIHATPDALRLSFLASLMEDIIFFGLVGLAGVALQVYGARGDILRKRVQYIFANAVVSYPALEYIEAVVRRNAVYAENAEHRLEILEYRPEYCAYRVAFHNRYMLKNLFGDMPYESELSVEVAPDLMKEGIDPLGIVSSIRLTPIGTSQSHQEFIDSLTPLTSTGVKRMVKVALPANGSAVYEMKWWSWVSNVGESGFSLKRFSEKTSIVVENKSHVTARVVRGNGSTAEICLNYGEEVTIADAKDVIENTRLHFRWLPPKGLDTQVDASASGGGLHPILTSSRKVGDSIKDEL